VPKVGYVLTECVMHSKVDTLLVYFTATWKIWSAVASALRHRYSWWNDWTVLFPRLQKS